MTTELQVYEEEYIDALDQVELNTNYLLDYNEEDRRITATYPADADTEEYIVSVYSAEDGEVELPDGSQILDVGGGSVVALTPAHHYEG